MWDTDGGGSFECVWEGYMWTLCTFHSAFCEPKTLSNNLIIKKKNLFQNRVFRAKIFHKTMRQNENYHGNES